MRFPPALVAALLALAFPAAAQVSGEGTASAGVLQSGGPDVSHEQPLSNRGLWFAGSLSAYSASKTFALQWEGAGTPDFRLSGTLFRPGWLLEAFVVQRAYFVGGDARFAWNPYTDVADARVPVTLERYSPLRGSPVGRFDPSTVPTAREFLPDSSPGWAMRDYALTFRTLGRARGVEVAVLSNERSGVVPRTFVTATGFAPGLTALTSALPIGAPFGVVEVPERFCEQSMGLDVRAFFTQSRWRWEAEAFVERYRLHRLATAWANPFPGPSLREPAYFRGTQALLKVSGRGPWASVSAERTEQWGHGEAGERRVGVTRIDAELRARRAGMSWFARGHAARRDDSASLEPPGLHPVFQGPYYDLLGVRLAPMPLRVYPSTDLWLEGGVKSGPWEASGRLRRYRSPHAYAGETRSLLLLLALSTSAGLRVELRPCVTRASDLNPSADTLNAGWSQAVGFRPVQARDWKGADAAIRYQRGPLMVRGFYGLHTAGEAPGLQRRESGEIFAGVASSSGPWTLRGSGRLSRAVLSGKFTTYALPGEPVDPADPGHRLPMGERWRRSAQSVQTELARTTVPVGTFGFLGRWDHETLATDLVLDQPRRYQYARVGCFYSRDRGALGLRAEVGVESYRLQDSAFLPSSPPPGPYLWAGLSERPGTRAYLRLNVTLKF